VVVFIRSWAKAAMIGDDTVIYYHRLCGWHSEPFSGAMVNQCPICGQYNILSFILYKAGKEDKQAAALLRERLERST
jgi:hypothetical protein